MTNLENLAFEATKNILEHNLQIYNPKIVGKKVVLIYDLDSTLSKLISYGYIENLKSYPNAEIIEFCKYSPIEIKEKILSLEEYCAVIMVESTNFRLEEFRIRMSLQHRNIAGIEHNHLKYIKENETQTYLEAISYQTPYFKEVSNFLKQKVESGKTMKIVSSNGSILELEGGFEEMKQNTGDFTLENRYGTYPIGENFSEIIDFSKANGSLFIKAYPGEDLQMIFEENPFEIKIKESLVYVDINKTPINFLKIIDKIKNDEKEVMMRELGFGLNKAINWSKTLSDVNPFERMSGFHISLGKKHNIYRKKFNKDIVQKYHIDIFPEVKEIYIDDVLVFNKEKHFIYKPIN